MHKLPIKMSAKVINYKGDSPLIEKLGYLQKRVAYLEEKSRSQEVKIDILMTQLEKIQAYVGYEEIDPLNKPCEPAADEAEFESDIENIEILYPDSDSTVDIRDTEEIIVVDNDVKPVIFNATHPHLKIEKVFSSFSSGDLWPNIEHMEGGVNGNLQTFGTHTSPQTQIQTQTTKNNVYKNYSKEQLSSAIAEVARGVSSARQAGRKFGVPSRTLYDKLKRLGIPNNGSYMSKNSSFIAHRDENETDTSMNTLSNSQQQDNIGNMDENRDGYLPSLGSLKNFFLVN